MTSFSHLIIRLENIKFNLKLIAIENSLKPSDDKYYHFMTSPVTFKVKYDQTENKIVPTIINPKPHITVYSTHIKNTNVKVHLVIHVNDKTNCF